MTADQFNHGFEAAGVRVEHFFGNDGSGVYIKATHVLAGTELSMHAHTFTHKSVLCAGRAELLVDDQTPQVLVGPVTLTVKAGHLHKVRAVTDVLWLCIHATDEADPGHIDRAITGG